MRKVVFVAVVLALAAMSIEPLGWLVVEEPGKWVHRQAGFLIGVSLIVIGAVCWFVIRRRGQPSF